MYKITTILALILVINVTGQITYLQKPENLDSISFDSLLVLADGGSANANEQLETGIVDLLMENGRPCSPALDFIPPGTDLALLTPDTLKEMIVERGYDAVILIDLFNIHYKESKKNNIQGGNVMQTDDGERFDIASINLFGHNGITKTVSKVDIKCTFILEEGGKIFEFIVSVKNPKNPKKFQKKLYKLLEKELARVKFF